MPGRVREPEYEDARLGGRFFEKGGLFVQVAEPHPGKQWRHAAKNRIAGIDRVSGGHAHDDEGISDDFAGHGTDVIEPFAENHDDHGKFADLREIDGRDRREHSERVLVIARHRRRLREHRHAPARQGLSERGVFPLAVNPVFHSQNSTPS